MIERLHTRLGTGGLVIAIIALVLALAGGAFAASGGLTGKQKKEVKAIAKSFQGTGPAGTNGTNGTNGAAGAKGDSGAPGAPGKNGESVKISSAPPAECIEGGSKFTVGTEKGVACNGEEGEEGPPGPTCDEATGKCLLPPGATETGIWSVYSPKVTEFGLLVVPISYPLRLSQAPNQAHYVTLAEQTGGTVPADCPGTVGNPQASPGTICLYAQEEENVTGLPAILNQGPSPTSGRDLRFFTNHEGEAFAIGSWAVTECPDGGCGP